MPRSPHKYHFIYKTTCKITEKFYIGMHSTSNLEDGYMGSGKIIRYSLIKYGKDAHVFEILEFKDDRESLRLREKEIVTKDLLADPLCMNLHLGGVGFEEHSEESRNKISKGLNRSYIEIYGEKEAIEQKEKRSIKAKSQWKNKTDEEKKTIFKKISKTRKTNNKSTILHIYTCPHCNTEGKGSSMLRHHFDNCPLYTGIPRKSVKWSEEAKLKVKMTKKPVSEETRNKLRGKSPSNKGIKSERIICPYCNKNVAVSIKNRHHFENCKNKL